VRRRIRLKPLRFAAVLLLFTLSASAQGSKTTSSPPGKAPAPQPVQPRTVTETANAAIPKKVENYLRRLYAWGPQYKITIGAPVQTPVAGLLQVSVEIASGGQTNSGLVFVSDDGRFLFQGELEDITADHFGQVRRIMHLEDVPSQGPASARVVVVEYADFQCPSCLALQQTLKGIKPNYPMVRFVYRDFPLTRVHPWAMSAAIAGRCVYSQKPAAFWAFHDAVYEGQDITTVDNAWDRLVELAGKAGADQGAFKACMASPEARKAVEDSMQEGLSLKVTNTPTVFVNGRRLVGGDKDLLEQFIQFDLADTAPKSPIRPTTSAKPKN
jgi:protein-disulfide isomerase